MPSLRERKRYIAYEIVSDKPIRDIKTVSKAFTAKAVQFLGELGAAEAGIMFIDNIYTEKQRGLIRVDHKSMDKVRATMALMDQIDGQHVIMRSRGVSGILKKAESKFIAG